RWLTVQPPGNTGQHFLLMDPSHSMLDEQTGAAVRGLVAKGALSPGVMATSDCRGDYETRVKRGVEFPSPPAERPYGIEAILRDDSGNWFSFTERKQQWSLPIGRPRIYRVHFAPVFPDEVPTKIRETLAVRLAGTEVLPGSRLAAALD